MKYILKLLIIIMFNICVIAVAGYCARERESLPASAQVYEGVEYAQAADPECLLLARLIAAECPGEPYTGMVAVGAVALNRVQHPSFPDTLAGVAYQPGGFVSVGDGKLDGADDTAMRAAKEALNGFDPSGGAVYYYNRNDKKESQRFAGRQDTKIIGSRRFCK